MVIFLDADDLLEPCALAMLLSLDWHGVAKTHWPLQIIDGDGNDRGQLLPPDALPRGDLRDSLISEGPWMADNPPTSGNAWSRGCLERLPPMPEAPFRISADAYLLALAPLLGGLRAIDVPLGRYRVHGKNNFFEKPFGEEL